MSKITDRIKVGELEFLLADKDMPITLDGTMVPLKNPDGTWNFITCDLGEKPYHHKFIGTPDDIYAKHGFCTMDANGHWDTYPSGIWPWSAYKCEDGMIFCFCHRELLSRTDPNFRNYFFTGIAVSYDNGDNWKYLGDILGTPRNGTTKETGNMGGLPMFVKDDYIYIYFNDYCKDGSRRWISGARMKLSETIAAVKEGKLPTVRKYSGTGRWDTDPFDEMGASILPIIDGINPDSHSKGVYVRPLDRYMMTMQTGSVGKLVAYFSQDGEHFDDFMVLDENDEKLMQPYSFFISTDGDCTDDMREVGKEFYIYFPHKGCGHDGKTYSYDEQYRRKIIIE